MNAATGWITGTPTGANGGQGTKVMSVTVTDSAATHASSTVVFSMQLNDAPLFITTPLNLPSGTTNTPYVGVPLTATGGRPQAGGVYTWSIFGGGSFDGLTIGSVSGGPGIVGTPTNALSSSTTQPFIVSATDADGNMVSAAFNIAIAASNTISIVPKPLPSAKVNIAYPSQTLTAAGGNGPGSYTWSVASGSLPPGLSMSSTGTISGTPTTPGTYNFTVSANDGTRSGSYSFMIIVGGGMVVTPTTLTSEISVPYSQVLTASGGTGPYTWSGTVPSGFALTPTGAATALLTNTTGPSAPGTSTFSLTITDQASGATSTQTFTLNVIPGPTITTNSPLPSGTINVPYQGVTFAASNGSIPFTWTYTGTLPPGMSLSTDGKLTGTPTVIGDFSPIVQVGDSAGVTNSKSFTLHIAATPPPLTVTCTPSATTLPLGGQLTFTANPNGGSQSFSSFAWSGSYSQSTTGPTLTKIPSATGTINESVTVTDSNNNTSSLGACPAVTVTLPITDYIRLGGRIIAVEKK